jgi:hypothetical protein
MTTTKSKSSDDGTDNESGTPTSSTGVATPASGSYAAQRDYARQTGAMNIPAPVKPPPLPSSNTLAQGSAAWSKSLAAERTTEAEQRMLGHKPVTLPATQTEGNSLLPQPLSRAAQRLANFSAVRAADRAAPSISSRSVEGAPGVRRYDRQGEAPMYSNVESPWDDKIGTVSTIPSENMRNPSGAVSRMVGPALQAAADRGDFRAVRQHYQRGGGTFNGETAEQTALRRMTEPSGSVKIGSQAKIDAEREQGRIDRMAGEVERLVKSGNYKGASVLQREVDGMRNVAGAGLRRESERQAQADAERAGRVTDLRTAVQQQEQAPAARTDLRIKQAELDELERKQSLMDRIVGVDRDDARKALEQYQAIYHKPTEDRDKYATFYEEVPLTANPQDGTRKVPFLINQRTGETRPIDQQRQTAQQMPAQQMPKGVSPQQAYDAARQALEQGVSTDQVNARLLAYGLQPIGGKQ